MSRLIPTVVLAAALTGVVGAAGQKAEEHRLENGLTVLLRPMDGAQQVALVVLYSVGGDHDPEGRSGLAHLIEHLYVTAAAGATRARTIAAYVRRYPAGWNAQTGDTYTVVATVFAKEALESELQDAAARMGDLRIEPSDLDREKPRLLAELTNMFGGIPALATRNLARERVRPTPAGGRKGGVPDHVRALTLDQVRERWRRYYKPRNGILVLAGGFDPQSARTMIRKHFVDLPAGELAPAPQPPGQPRLGTMEQVTVKSVRPNVGAQACLAYRAPSPGSELYAPFLVLMARMWRAMRPGAQQGRVAVCYTPVDDPAWFGVSTSVGAKGAADEAVARLQAFVSAAIEPDLALSELLATRNAFGPLLGTAELPDAMLAQNVYGVAFSLGRRMQLGIDPEELTKAIQGVTRDDLRRAARAIFAPEQRAAIVVTPED